MARWLPKAVKMTGKFDCISPIVITPILAAIPAEQTLLTNRTIGLIKAQHEEWQQLFTAIDRERC